MSICVPFTVVRSSWWYLFCVIFGFLSFIDNPTITFSALCRFSFGTWLSTLRIVLTIPIERASVRRISRFLASHFLPGLSHTVVGHFKILPFWFWSISQTSFSSGSFSRGWSCIFGWIVSHLMKTYPWVASLGRLWQVPTHYRFSALLLLASNFRSPPWGCRGRFLWLKFNWKREGLPSACQTSLLCPWSQRSSLLRLFRRWWGIYRLQ